MKMENYNAAETGLQIVQSLQFVKSLSNVITFVCSKNHIQVSTMVTHKGLIKNMCDLVIIIGGYDSFGGHGEYGGYTGTNKVGTG